MKFKYRTTHQDGSTLVLRTPASNKNWPRDELDCETLLVPTADRAEALRVAKATPAVHWG